jgi:MFS family permease
MLCNLGLAAVSIHVSRTLPLACALLVCGLSCAALTTVTDAWAFALALLIFNASWFMCYPLLMGIGYSVDDSGRLAILSSAVWLLMMSLGSLATGFIAELLGGFRPVGPMGLVGCAATIVVIWPLARRLDRVRPLRLTKRWSLKPDTLL